MLRNVLETGLIVTYCRPFTKSHGLGAIPREWVPTEHRAFHDFLMERRKTHSAHNDATAALPHRRVVSADGDGWHMIAHPDQLTADQLRELAELALMMSRIVLERVEREKAARAVQTPEQTGISL